MKPPSHKFIILSFFILTGTFTNAQKETTKIYYEDGKLASKGQTYTYSIPYEDKRVPKKFPFAEVQKKIKKWEYWYQNGRLRKIENYKLIKDRNFYSLPHGKWVYFNETGTKYREETYNEGTLISTSKEVFQDSRMVGSVTLKNGIPDTNIYSPITKGKNLVINSDFDFYYYKPVLITYHGETRIEDWIPFWTTPGLYTPDYLSNLRYIDVFSYSFIFGMPVPDKFNYAGIALYKESDSYSEYIQGRLVKPLNRGKKYCLRTSIILSSYSRYSVDRLGFNFSSSPVSVSYNDEDTFSPQVRFSLLPIENRHFTTLCDYFIADGGERFITAGRFTRPENLVIEKREDFVEGLFGLEKSSYYIIDNIDLFEIQDTTECDCKTEIPPGSPIKNKPDLFYETDLNRLKQGIPVMLENVNFKFDSSDLLPGSEEILDILLIYLENNPEIKIGIEGHTDDIGTEEYNDELSVNRAKAVYTWLINKGIDANRLSFTGFGKSRPIFNKKDEEHRALNRRVEVRIIKN